MTGTREWYAINLGTKVIISVYKGVKLVWIAVSKYWRRKDIWKSKQIW